MFEGKSKHKDVFEQRIESLKEFTARIDERVQQGLQDGTLPTTPEVRDDFDPFGIDWSWEDTLVKPCIQQQVVEKWDSPHGSS
jgi:hypothetical protein